VRERGIFGPFPARRADPTLMLMARYRIDDEDASVFIEVTGVAGQEQELLEAFGECQAGQCSCPAGEYQKLASMDVQHTGDVIRIRLEPTAGQVLNTRQIAACLDYTTATASGAMDDEQRGPTAAS
jgi:hypothetical protein